MNFHQRYKISVENESTLENKARASLPLYSWVLIGITITITAIIIGALCIILTPLKTYLPGYLKDSERADTEEQHLRLDSLLHVYEINESYISNIFNALNPVLPDTNLSEKGYIASLFSSDSILDTSNEEKLFLEAIRERDKFNISAASPADAETIMFGSVNDMGVISDETKNSFIADIYIPLRGDICAVAEGKVISIASSSPPGSYEIIIQHPRGFLSKTGRLDHPYVKPGENVIPGQIIAPSNSHNGRNSSRVSFELWHDGDRLIPSRYLNGGNSD